ncbi:MAG TPA: TonB C-terminal domain-containing protein [Polyangia bacterium]|nr:TonB C-terminal domain-containing protein [Polyangia bacterium]
MALVLLATCGAAPTARAAPPRAAPPRADATPRRPEPPITTPGVEGDYLRALHRTIHFRWANMFIEEVADKRPPGDPLNNPSLETEILFIVRWDGSPAEVTVTKSSGVPAFDQAAIGAIKGDVPFPVPPIDVYGDDGVAHFRWVLARDYRLCSEGEVRRVEAPLAEALPRLFFQGRIKEALLRVARYTRNGDLNAMTTFARAWLARRQEDPALDVRAAAALAETGDARQAARLRPGLKRPDTVAIAAPALAALKVDLCAEVRPRLTPADPQGILAAARVLQLGHQELPASSPCVAALDGLLKADALPATVRAEVLKTLAVVSPGTVRRPALNALGDSDAHMRAAGAEVFARPGGGRPTLYRLQPLVKDPSVEVRSAVAAGLIRACGDLANDYVMPLMKAREPQPLAAMAPELGKETSAASLDLLAKMEKRGDRELRTPVLAALAERTDAAGRALYQPVAAAVKKDPYASPEARRIVYANADVNELVPLMSDPALGLEGFKALLHAQRRAEAMDWLVKSFDRLPPETLVDAFGAWLAIPPAHAASK